MYNFLPKKKETIDFKQHTIQSNGNGYYIIKLDSEPQNPIWITLKKDFYDDAINNKTLFADEFSFIDENYEIKKVGKFINGLADAVVEYKPRNSLHHFIEKKDIPAIISKSGYVKTQFSTNHSIDSFKKLASQVFVNPKFFEDIISQANITDLNDLNIITDVALHGIEDVFDDLKKKELITSINKDEHSEFMIQKNSITDYLKDTPEDIYNAYQKLYNQISNPEPVKRQESKPKEKLNSNILDLLNESIESQPGNCDG